MPLVLAQSASTATIGIVVIFLVLFPVLVQGIIGFIAAQIAGERAENQRYADGDASPS